ncbi:hypothetical protein [Pontibacillus marinus]|uniref:DUF4179 domain-containing protein n=1 Tax=Pontibacillus marinus BH030004 = DSM 16465 TaxID=1385511 RepID=A0A0A5HVH0_9BACI|nr:hypothetical protein [Pontibacillus marinus]KGX87637.1 hypothetical protein N783_09475 [Pontibacillus marinus BH030004 = DSM 16465]
MKHKKIYISLFSFFLLAVAIYFFTPSSSKTYPSLENEEFKSVDSKEKVQAYYESITPGLKRAEKLGVVKKLDKKIDLGGFKESIDLEKIWYTNKEVHLFYNRDIKSIGKNEYGDRMIEVPQINVKIDHEKEQNIHNISGGFQRDTGVQYKGRFYSVVSFQVRNENYDHITNIEDIVHAKLHANVKGESKSFDVSLPFSYNPSSEKVQSVPFDQKFSYNGVTINFTSLEIGTSQNRLHFTVDQPKDHFFHNVLLRLNSSNVKQKTIAYTHKNKETQKENDFYVEWDPFNETPENLSLTLQHARLIGSDSLNFEIDFPSYYSEHNKEEIDLDRKLTTIKNTSIILDRIFLEDTKERLGIFLHHKYEDAETPSITLSTGIGTSRAFDPNHPTPVAKAYLNKKKPLSLAVSGGYGRENSYQISWYIEEQKLNTPLRVQIEKLAYQINFDKDFNINIK